MTTPLKDTIWENVCDFFRSRKTAILSTLAAFLFYLAGDGMDVQVARMLNISQDSADRVTDVAKFLTTFLAMMGFSPMAEKKPKVQP